VTTEVLECNNLNKEAFDKWLSSKQDVHKDIYKEKKKNAAKAAVKAKMKCGTKHVRK
jgi:hypothetical protein